MSTLISPCEPGLRLKIYWTCTQRAGHFVQPLDRRRYRSRNVETTNMLYIIMSLAHGCPQVVAQGDFSTYSCHLRHLLFHIFHILTSNPIKNESISPPTLANAPQPCVSGLGHHNVVALYLIQTNLLCRYDWSFISEAHGVGIDQEQSPPKLDLDMDSDSPGQFKRDLLHRETKYSYK